MSYNLLRNTDFTNTEKMKQAWLFKNCTIDGGGYLFSNLKVFLIELTVVLPNPTKLYLSFDYINFDKTVERVYCAIDEGDNTLYVEYVKHPHKGKQKRISIVKTVTHEQIKVRFIVESQKVLSKIFVTNPLLIDLAENGKTYWAKSILDKVLTYKGGYNYQNMYKENEITVDNLDFHSCFSPTVVKAKTGILLTQHPCSKESYEIRAENIKQGEYYLLKMDYKLLNLYGQINVSYNNTLKSTLLDDEQLYLIFKGQQNAKLKLNIENEDILPYIINLKHLLLISLKDQPIEFNDIPHMPFT